MTNRKQNLKIYFSVEGETEQWYLTWLQQQINGQENSKFNVKFDIKVQKDPVKRVKSVSFFGKATFIHFFDFESQESKHVKQVQNTLGRMKECQSLKRVSYKMAYSNFAFELWVLLHKCCLLQSLTHRDQYLNEINRVFGEKFENLQQYKHEKEFKRILQKLNFEDVLLAIENAKKIENQNIQYHQRRGYKGYYYFGENPSLSVGQIIEEILCKCGLVSKNN